MRMLLSYMLLSIDFIDKLIECFPRQRRSRFKYSNLFVAGLSASTSTYLVDIFAEWLVCPRFFVPGVRDYAMSKHPTVNPVKVIKIFFYLNLLSFYSEIFHIAIEQCWQ